MKSEDFRVIADAMRTARPSKSSTSDSDSMHSAWHQWIRCLTALEARLSEHYPEFDVLRFDDHARHGR